MGLISTRIMEQVFGREWQITSKGLFVLEKEYKVFLTEDDDEDRPQQQARNPKERRST
jgi:hypothetical protein